MTCIIGAVQGNTSYIAADSAFVFIETGNFYTPNSLKIFHREGLLFGMAGSIREDQIIQYGFKIPSTKNVTRAKADDWIVSKLIPSIISKIEKESRIIDNDKYETELLLIFKNRMFVIDTSFGIAEHTNGFCSIGCGSPFALGALEIMNENENITIYNKVHRALQTAVKYNNTVRPPFHFLIKSKNGNVSHCIENE